MKHNFLTNFYVLLKILSFLLVDINLKYSKESRNHKINSSREEKTQNNSFNMPRLSEVRLQKSYFLDSIVKIKNDDFDTSIRFDALLKDENLSLKREIQKLKDALLDAERQCEWYKRTLKYTELNELKLENQIMNNELKRLRKIIDENFGEKKQRNDEENEKIEDLKDENSQLAQRIQELESNLSKMSVENKTKLLSVKNILAQVNISINKKEEEILKYNKVEADYIQQIESLK